MHAPPAQPLSRSTPTPRPHSHRPTSTTPRRSAHPRSRTVRTNFAIDLRLRSAGGFVAPNSTGASQEGTVSAVQNKNVPFDSFDVKRSFKSSREAAIYAAQVMKQTEGIQKYIKSTEYGAGIYYNKKDKQYYLTPITNGYEGKWIQTNDPVSAHKNPLYFSIVRGERPDYEMRSFIHSHPNAGRGDRFSAGDADFVNSGRFYEGGYVLTPSRGLLTMPYNTDMNPYAPGYGDYLKGIPVPLD